MAYNENTFKYEFSESENLVLSVLSKHLRKLGVAVLIGGLLFVAYLVVSFLDPISLVEVSDTQNMVLSTIDYALWVLIALLVIYLSIMTIHMAKPIRLIAETTGADITHLMDFLDHLSRVSRTSFRALIAICILMAASLVLLILVF